MATQVASSLLLVIGVVMIGFDRTAFLDRIARPPPRFLALVSHLSAFGFLEETTCTHEGTSKLPHQVDRLARFARDHDVRVPIYLPMAVAIEALTARDGPFVFRRRPRMALTVTAGAERSFVGPVGLGNAPDDRLRKGERDLASARQVASECPVDMSV